MHEPLGASRPRRELASFVSPDEAKRRHEALVEELTKEREDAGEVCTCHYYPESCALQYDNWFL